MGQRVTARYFLLLFFLLYFGACGANTPAPQHGAGAGEPAGSVVAPTNTQDITGALWKWQGTRVNNDTESVPSAPEHYTLQFGPKGRVAIRADCNRGGGTYKIEENRISIEITHTTRAACPPDSLEETYIRDLNGAALLFFREDSLYIDLVYDTGTMRFSR